MSLKIENEPIGSLPRSSELIQSINDFRKNIIDCPTLEKKCSCEIKKTIQELIESKQNVVTDGEQSKISFIGYPLFNSNQVDGDGHVDMEKNNGVRISFNDGHTRNIPLLNGKNLPFKYARYAGDFVNEAIPLVPQGVKYKQAVISPSAISLIYPPFGIEDYPKQDFINDLINESEKDIRSCFNNGADIVQLDATELRLSLLLDPSGDLFQSLLDIINKTLSRFSPYELANIGIHICRGGDQGSPHSDKVDLVQLIPKLLTLRCSRFYIELASEPNKSQIISSVADNIKPNKKVFFGVTKISQSVETVDEIIETISQIAGKLPIEQFGITDSCGFSPFYDDQTCSRDIAFAKMKNRSEAVENFEKLLSK
ncbi:hypothetical protein ACTFIZ_012274 [Dictyostelium cf. discoideum]